MTFPTVPNQTRLVAIQTPTCLALAQQLDVRRTADSERLTMMDLKPVLNSMPIILVYPTAMALPNTVVELSMMHLTITRYLTWWGRVCSPQLMAFCLPVGMAWCILEIWLLEPWVGTWVGTMCHSTQWGYHRKWLLMARGKEETCRSNLHTPDMHR